ncbi:MAG: hypothetical protein AD742_10695 [Methylibium sp. NZG]|nr:MAG: hypothetical protein AD742_10695 [Methylibium sp. NZG]
MVVLLRKPAAEPASPAAPLTHHDILGLIGPFTRRGRQLDLPASDRLARRLVFKPVAHAGSEGGGAELTETLQLENPEEGHFRLTRVVAHPAGPSARLLTEGPEPGELLAAIDAVPPQRHFQALAGGMVARSYRLKLGTPQPPLVLTNGVAQLDALMLKLRVPEVTGISGEIEVLAATDNPTLALPEDLLAVLGWDWTRLDRHRDRWTGRLHLRKSEPDRSQDAERKLERMAQHLAQTLAEPPGRFHERASAARWGVALRRAVPLLTCVGLIAGAVAVPSLDLGPDSIFRMLIFHAPPLLLMAGICMREMPRIEIPPLPRASRAASWREPAQAPRAPADQPTLR